MSLISWLIWSSSLATGSGVGGPPGPLGTEAEAESEPPEPGTAVSNSPKEASGDSALEVADDAHVGLALGAWCLPHAITATQTSSAAAANPMARARFRVSTHPPLRHSEWARPIMDGRDPLGHARDVSAT